jgi:uncharacterized membrane protein
MLVNLIYLALISTFIVLVVVGLKMEKRRNAEAIAENAKRIKENKRI